MLYLQFSWNLFLECTKDDFSLSRFEAINHGWNRTNIVGHGEKDQLLVDKVLDWDLVDTGIEKSAGLKSHGGNGTDMLIGRL